MQIDDDVLELLALGVATIVASRDEELRPEIARGWGISVSPDRSEATLGIPVVDGEEPPVETVLPPVDEIVRAFAPYGCEIVGPPPML